MNGDHVKPICLQTKSMQLPQIDLVWQIWKNSSNKLYMKTISPWSLYGQDLWLRPMKINNFYLVLWVTYIVFVSCNFFMHKPYQLNWKQVFVYDDNFLRREGGSRSSAPSSSNFAHHQKDVALAHYLKKFNHQKVHLTFIHTRYDTYNFDNKKLESWWIQLWWADHNISQGILRR